jgi:hypothetical protein
VGDDPAPGLGGAARSRGFERAFAELGWRVIAPAVGGRDPGLVATV